MPKQPNMMLNTKLPKFLHFPTIHNFATLKFTNLFDCFGHWQSNHSKPVSDFFTVMFQVYSLPHSYWYDRDRLSPQMLFPRLKSWPKWRPCCLLHFKSTAFICRAQDPGNGPRKFGAKIQPIRWLITRSFRNQFTPSLIHFVRSSCWGFKSSSKMPKRPFPFNGCSPLQLKTHVNAFHFEKANHMDSIYGR